MNFHPTTFNVKYSNTRNMFPIEKKKTEKNFHIQVEDIYFYLIRYAFLILLRFQRIFFSPFFFSFFFHFNQFRYAHAEANARAKANILSISAIFLVCRTFFFLLSHKVLQYKLIRLIHNGVKQKCIFQQIFQN